MGADGHIAIIRVDKLVEQYPDALEQLSRVSTFYTNTLDDVRYAHIYHGDNLCASPWDATDSFADSKDQPRLQEILDWFDKNSTSWEVWT